MRNQADSADADLLGGLLPALRLGSGPPLLGWPPTSDLVEAVG
jgi:hypothetical protein